MKVVQINSVCGSGSTGKICVAVSELLTECGIENYIFYSHGNSEYPLGIKYMFEEEGKIQAFKSRFLGNYGFQSENATFRLIEKLDKVSPDVVHLHNLHSHNVNLDILFSYFKKKKIKVFWTFHDCWAFTAYCMYFDAVHCDKWMTGCEKCPQFKKYSYFFDRSKYLHKKKRELFSGLDLTIITPSEWLAEIIKRTFLNEYPVKIINNGIDLDAFSPKESDLREKYGISEDKKILLGVANKWEPRKGLDIFIRLSEGLNQEKFQIILVGTNNEVDKKLPHEIISIHRTSSQQELAEIYSAADYFINPTREDNFPTVNIEALACGTPVITFKTGGSPEIIDETCGCVVSEDGMIEFFEKVLCNEQKNYFHREKCRRRAMCFDAKQKFDEYAKLYIEKEET